MGAEPDGSGVLRSTGCQARQVVGREYRGLSLWGLHTDDVTLFFMNAV